MAKGHRTSKTRRATAAKATLTLEQVSTRICGLEDAAHAEAFSLQHLGELLALFGEHVGGPGKDWSDMEMQRIGLRIEYMGGLVKHHADAISETLSDMRGAAERMTKGGAQ